VLASLYLNNNDRNARSAEVKHGLHEMRAGEGGVIALLFGEDAMSRRLADLGFTEGASVNCLYKSPSGDPAAYLVRGTVIALRREDAARVEVRL